MDESPFKKTPEMRRNTDSTTGKFELSLIAKFKEILVRFIPFIGDIHPDYLFPISFAISVVMAAIFCSIFITGYYEALDKQFLSPISGTTPSTYCQTIAAVNTGDYLATESGLWEGNTAFQFAQAAYTASITSWEGSYEEYSILMNDIYFSLQHFGQLATHNDLAQNLVYWMSLVFVVPYSNAQRFYLNGTPLTVLNRQNTGGTVSNLFGDCNASSTASFDQSNGLLVLVYNYDEFASNPLCNDTNPAQLGYTPGINSQFFTIKFDVRTLVTSLAINLNITLLSDVVEIPGFNTNYTYDGVMYNVSSYYDPKYPGMAPLTCIKSPISQCILAIGESYALPIFNHAGASLISPVVCDCSVLSAEYLSDRYSQCNLFSFLSGFMFWNTNNGSPNPIFELAQRYNYDYTRINGDAFNASFVASYWGTTSPDREALNSPASRERAYAFCNVSDYGPCSLVTFSSFDDVHNSWAVSEYYYQLQTGACSNTLSGSYADWQKLVDTPYAPLTQQYQQCTSSPRILLFTQAGITMGNVYLLLPFCALFFVGLLELYKRCRGGGALHEKLYSEYEVKEALRTLSVSLLLARDGKIGDSTLSREGGRLDSLVVRLTEELTQCSEVINNREHGVVTASAGSENGVKNNDNSGSLKKKLTTSPSSTSDNMLSNLEDGQQVATRGSCSSRSDGDGSSHAAAAIPMETGRGCVKSPVHDTL